MFEWHHFLEVVLKMLEKLRLRPRRPLPSPSHSGLIRPWALTIPSPYSACPGIRPPAPPSLLSRISGSASPRPRDVAVGPQSPSPGTPAQQ